MVIRARVNIETASRRYRPGEAITEQLSEADLAHFRERNFIIEEEEMMEGEGACGKYGYLDLNGFICFTIFFSTAFSAGFMKAVWFPSKRESWSTEAF